jgi:hypothetical protein
MIARWKGIIEEIHFRQILKELKYCKPFSQKTSFRASKWPRKLKTAKNSKLPKLSENCFEPVGKGGWPPISTWITRMIAKVERMNLNQENLKADPGMAESQKESEKVLLQMKETMNDHRHIILSGIFKEKECIEARIGDFDIDCVLDEETQVKIMTERT